MTLDGSSLALVVGGCTVGGALLGFAVRAFTFGESAGEMKNRLAALERDIKEAKEKIVKLEALAATVAVVENELENMGAKIDEVKGHMREINRKLDLLLAARPSMQHQQV